MKTFLRSLLLSACAGSAAWGQQPPAGSNHPPAIQKMLDAPVWYLTYTVRLEANGSDGRSSGTHSLRRVTSGRMMLGIRSGGPSLSTIANPTLMVLTQPDQIDKLVANYANWIQGPPPEDENLPPAQRMTEAQADAHFARVRLQNLEAHMQFSYDYNGPSHVGGTDRTQQSGSGTVWHVGEPAFEIDAVNRKFRLMHSFGFTDGPATINARTGTTETGIGTIHYNRQVIKTGLHPFEAIGSMTPAFGTPGAPFLEGTLPNGGNISYSSVHAIQLGPGPAHGVRGTYSIAFTLSPDPPEEVDLWIELPPNYDKWLPEGDVDERTAADFVPIKVVLEKRGGGVPRFKANKFYFFLKKTTREKGVCLNWPPLLPANAPGANDPPPFDLQFESAKNPAMVIVGEGQAGDLMTPDKLTAEVKISSFDYGAYGEFEASAVLENTVVVYGKVRGTTDQQTVKLPLCKDGSIIATRFLDDHGVSNLPDNDDSDNDPVGDGFKGDGLTLYEEYRGFMQGNMWKNCDPKKKDIFVLNEMRAIGSISLGITYFETATSLKVHSLLRKNQVDDNGVINFSRTSGPHVVDQHAIRIKPFMLFSQGGTYARVAKVGTPGTAKWLVVPPDLGVALGVRYMGMTVAHEMLHCVNVYHHGENDKLVWWYYTPNTNPADQFYESEDTSISPLPLQNRVRSPITVKYENGAVVQPSGYFPGNGDRRLVDIGVMHGLHSGTEYCLMRYSNAMAYPSETDPNNVRYLTISEPEGTGLCSSPAGTGVNANGRNPQSRYGRAATPANGGYDANGAAHVKANRGSCEKQIRVNDRDQEPER